MNTRFFIIIFCLITIVATYSNMIKVVNNEIEGVEELGPDYQILLDKITGPGIYLE